MLERLRQAIEAGHSAVAETLGVAEPAEKPILALLVLDEIGPPAAKLRQRHLAAAEAEGSRALFILGPKSELEHPGLDLLCEYLPSPEDLARTTGERPDLIRRYREARLRLILDKWGVRECRWIGESAAEFVDAWCEVDDPTRRPVRFLSAR